MAQRIPSSNYFADDRDIYDLLSSSRQRLNAKRLFELARARGIIFSSQDDRETLARAISIMPFSWRQLSDLIHETDTVDRTERISSRNLVGKLTRETLDAAIALVKEARADYGETFRKLPGKTLQISVGYKELDTSCHRLAQRTKREFVLQFELDGDGNAKVRHQDQKRAYEVLDQLQDVLRESGEDVEDQSVVLTGIKDAGLRTEFFMRLIEGIEGYGKPLNVSSVKTSRFSVATIVAENDFGGGSEDDTRVTDEELELIALVRDVALRGDRVLNTPQYKHLVESGYFVRGITWVVGCDKDRIELEAGFSKKEACADFAYSVRGIFPQKGKKGEFRKSKIPADAIQRARVHPLIEGAAKKALAHVLAKAQGPVPKSDDEEAGQVGGGLLGFLEMGQ